MPDEEISNQPGTAKEFQDNTKHMTYREAIIQTVLYFVAVREATESNRIARTKNHFVVWKKGQAPMNIKTLPQNVN